MTLMFGQHELLCRCCHTKSIPNWSFPPSLSFFFFFMQDSVFPIPTPHSSWSQPSGLKKMILEGDWPGFARVDVLLAAGGFGVFVF